MAFAGGSGADTLNINGGTYTLGSDPIGGTASLALNVNAGSAVFNSSAHLASLTVASGAAAVFAPSGSRYLQTGSLSIAGTGKLDLNDNDLIVNNGSFTTIRALMLSGFSATPNASKAGIISTAGQNSSGKTILALFDNSLMNLTDWPIGSGNSIPATAIVGKYTYFGDATLDGQVTADDYLVLDANRDTTPAAGLAWIKGDMTNDGSVTADDYLVLDANRGLGMGSPL